MHTILQVTQHGARPPVPPHCPPALAALMARCWAEEPADRWGGGRGAGVQAQYCALPLLAAGAAHPFTAPSNPTRTHRPQFADIVPELQQQLAVVRAAQPPRPKRSASTATLPTSAALELSRAGSTAPLLLPTASGELPAVAVENTASGSPPSRQASLPHNASAPSLLQLTRAGSAAPLLPVSPSGELLAAAVECAASGAPPDVPAPGLNSTPAPAAQQLSRAGSAAPLLSSTASRNLPALE